MFGLIAALSLLYFFICALSYSPKSSVLYFWPLLSLFLFLCIPFPFLWKLLKIPFFLFWLLFFLFLLFWAREKGDEGEPDVLLVLGTRNDGTNPPALFYNRVRLAAKLLKKNPDLTAVLSGGKVFGEEISEARALKKALVQRGIAPQRLILEEASRSTKENFAFSHPNLEKFKRVGVVTGFYHVFRARKTRKEEEGKYLYFSTAAPAFFVPHLALREFFTFSVDFITGHINLFSRRNHL